MGFIRVLSELVIDLLYNIIELIKKFHLKKYLINNQIIKICKNHTTNNIFIYIHNKNNYLCYNQII